MSIVIRAIEPQDKAQWLNLFIGYQQFYRHILSDEFNQNAWQRLTDPAGNIQGLVAEQDGNLLGFCHFLYHSSTWNPAASCYLEDLFVSKAARGQQVARLLIEEVEQIAKQQGAFRLYLHTQSYNSSARSLYDSLLPFSPFVTYRKNL